MRTADYEAAVVRHLAYPRFERGPSSALKAKIDELDRRGLIDPARVGITAFSYGSNAVEPALVFSRRYSAASASWSPIAPAMSAFLPRAMARVEEALYGGGPYGGGLPKWREHSIAFNAEKVTTPLLIQVADREYFGSLQNFMALYNAGRPVEMYRFPDEHHVKWQPVHRYAVYNRNVDWFRFWLQDYQDPAPEKAGQYARWRALREKL